MNKIYEWVHIGERSEASLAITKAAFIDGGKTLAPTVPAFIIWAVVTAVAMVGAGLSPFDVILINLIVFAASAQLTVLSMLMLHAPMPIMWLAAMAVNLRFVIFSAGIRPYFRHLSLPRRLIYGFLNGDISSMLFTHRYRDTPPAPATVEQNAFFMGMGLINYVMWQVGTVFGVLFASAVPNEWGLKLAAALTLLVLVIKAVDHWAGVAGATVSALVAVSFQFLPYKLWVVAAIISGVAVAMLVEFVLPNAYLKAAARRASAKVEVESGEIV